MTYYNFSILLYNTINLLAIILTFFALRKGNKLLFPVYLFLITDIVSFAMKTLAYFLTNYGYTLEESSNVANLLDSVLDPIRYGFVAWFFFIIIELEEFRKFILMSVVAVAIFSLINAIFIQPDHRPTYLYYLVSLFQIILSMMLLVQVLELPVGNKLSGNPLFLISIAFLFVSIFSFFSFILEPYLFENGNNLYWTTFFHLLTFALVGFYTLIGIASAKFLKTPHLN